MNSEHSPEPKRELYRDPSRGKIWGVCAGLADYFGLELWVVRIIAVTLLLFFQFPIFIAYIIAFLVLEPKPETSRHDRHAGIKQKIRSGFGSKKQESSNSSATVQQVWKKGRVPGQKLKGLNKQLTSLEERLRAMETYVTSKQFELRKEFQNLSS